MTQKLATVLRKLPSEQFCPLPQETVEVVQVIPHERLLQRTDLCSVLAARHRLQLRSTC